MVEMVVILDVSLLDRGDIREQLERFGLVTLSGQELTKGLISWGKWEILRRRENSTFLLFPGKGALIVQAFLPSGWLDGWQWLYVYTKRHWVPGQCPRVEGGKIHQPRGIIFDSVSDVVILDDVVSSGTTCRLIREKNDTVFPGARWHVGSWIKQRSAVLPGFTSSYAVREFGSSDHKVPINSLSTLLREERIASSFTKRNLSDETQGDFLHLLADLRVKVGKEGLL